MLGTLTTAAGCALELQQLAPAPGLSTSDLAGLLDKLRGAQQTGRLEVTPLEVAQLHAALLLTCHAAQSPELLSVVRTPLAVTADELEDANRFLRDGLPPEWQALHPPTLRPQAVRA
ncbi:hypothetical protein D3875_02935 [Deinococcus cavernae]|uniref:Uncharacterized protein n=2 Tax=Deinococcus cavernae TaxID=2320857 RepID=A0A418VFU8_9DEIO|nr:hypothetical protein D3875_02935 [Deinococcus cavernae]